MGLALLLLVGVAQAAPPPRAEPFRVSCGDRYCTLRNEVAEFRATERGLGLEQIAGFGQGASIVLRLEARDGTFRVFSVTVGDESAIERSPRVLARQIGRKRLTSLIEPLSRAARVHIDDCGAPTEDAVALHSRCVITLSGLDNAVIEARTRLRMARRSY